MNFASRHLFTALPLLALLGPAPAVPPEPVARVWRAGVETHSAPFTYRDEQGRPAGFSVELLQAIAHTQDLQIEYRLLDWGDLLAEFNAGRIDIICNVVATPDRQEFMRTSATTVLMRGGLYRRRNSPAVRSIADLRGRRLAVPPDSRAHEYARQQGWGVEFVFGANLQACVQLVHEGRADLLLASSIVTDQLLRAGGLADITAANLQFPDFDYREHFGVRPDDNELLAQLNEGLLTAHRRGTYDQLYEKWVGPLEPHRLNWRDIQPYLPVLTALALAILGVFLWQRRLLDQLSRQAGEIRQKEERLRLVFEGSQDAFWDWDVRTDRVLRSPRWAGMLGYTLEEIGLHRQSFLNLVHPDDQAGVLADEKEIWLGRDQFAFEFRLRAKSGEWKWILDRGKVVARSPAAGEPLRIIGTHTDITGRKLAAEEADKLQRKMQEAQKLESLGVLAGGIAHDFNNLLTVILGNGALARLETKDPAVTATHLDAILTAANHASDLCRQLLAYAGKGSYTIQRINLNDLVTETTSLLELSLSKQAKLEFVLLPAMPKIDADPAQVRQVVMNLVMNAAEAIGDQAGTIRVSTTLVILPRPGIDTIPAMAEMEAGSYVCVEIADTGCGMKPEVLGRIFDPFFTTKFTGRGLGLAAVIGIMRTHHGALRVQSTPGKGTTFGVYLPVSSWQTRHPFTAPGPAAITPA